MLIKKILKRIVFGHRCSSEAYVAYLRKIGMKIGGERFFLLLKMYVLMLPDRG